MVLPLAVRTKKNGHNVKTTFRLCLLTPALRLFCMIAGARFLQIPLLARRGIWNVGLKWRQKISRYGFEGGGSRLISTTPSRPALNHFPII